MAPCGLSFCIPGMRLVNETNAREHWGIRTCRAKVQRETARMVTRHTINRTEVVFPVTVVITRIGPRKLDSDNLAASAKHVRDGIADALGIDDGDESKATWSYGQERGPWGMRAEIG